MKNKGLFISIALGAVLTSAMPAQAANLILNSGFETGNFAGWTLGGNSKSYVGVGGGWVGSGRYAAYFGPMGTDATLGQRVETIAGQNYEISFSLQNGMGGTNSFQVFFGDAPAAYSFTNEAAFDWTTLTFNATATTNSTWLSFQFRHDPSLFYLDDVIVKEQPGRPGAGNGPVSAVPEPDSWAMLIAGFGVLGYAVRRERRRHNRAGA